MARWPGEAPAARTRAAGPREGPPAAVAVGPGPVHRWACTRRAWRGGARSRLSPRPSGRSTFGSLLGSPQLPEEPPEELRRLGGEHARTHLAAMVEAAVAEQVPERV